MVFISSFVPEEFAVNDAVYQRFYPISIGAGAIENGFYFRSVAESYRSAGRVDHQLADEVARDLTLVLQQQALHVPHVVEGTPVGQNAGGVYRLRQMEDKGLAVFAEPGDLRAVAERAIVVAPAAEDVETFQ